TTLVTRGRSPGTSLFGKVAGIGIIGFLVGVIAATPTLALAAPPVVTPPPAATAQPAPVVVEPLPRAKDTATATTALPLPTNQTAVSTGAPAADVGAAGTAAIDVTPPPPTPAVPGATIPVYAPTTPLERVDRPVAIFEKWWFWTAVAAVAVTAVVIVATSSGPSAPSTDLGNMVAF
ncbi:MAG: hypothetical protein ABI560_12530, partial [Myxococcales bacterium]